MHIRRHLQKVLENATVPATFADISGEEFRTFCGIEIPVTVTSIAIRFIALAKDGTTALPITNADGTEYELTITAATAAYLSLDTSLLAGVEKMKIECQSTELSADKDFQLVSRKF